MVEETLRDERQDPGLCLGSPVDLKVERGKDGEGEGEREGEGKEGGEGGRECERER